MKIANLIKTTLISTALITSFSAFSEGYKKGQKHHIDKEGKGYGHHGMNSDMMHSPYSSDEQIDNKIAKMKENLGITDEQADELKSIMKEHSEEGKSIHQSMRESHDKIASLDASADEFEEHADEFATEQGELVTKMIQNKLSLKFEISQILIEEQRLKQAEHMKMMMEKHHGKKHKMKEGHEAKKHSDSEHEKEETTTS